MPTFKPYEGNEPFIFISYSHKNNADVFPILQRLHDCGLRIWYDRGIDPGSEWPEEIATHLLGCGLFLLFMSPDAAESHNVRREITMAVDRQKPLMNVFLKETELQPGLQLQLNLIQYISYNTDGETFDEFIERLAGILLKKAPDVAGDYVPPPVVTPPPAVMPPPITSEPKPKKKFKLWQILTPVCAVFLIAAALIVFLVTRDDEDHVPVLRERERGSSSRNNGENGGEDENENGGDNYSNGEDENNPDSDEIELDSAVLDGNFYVVLKGSESLEFTNTSAEKVDMPTSTEWVRADYVLFDRHGLATEYWYGSLSFGESLQPGSRIVISLADPAETTKLVIPVELIDTAVTVRALASPAINFVTLTGTGGLEITNNSQDVITFPQSVSFIRRDYAVFDKNGELTDYYNDTSYRADLEPGARKVISLTDPADTLELYYPAEWENTVIIVNETAVPAVHYVTLTSGSSAEFTNISDNVVRAPSAVDFAFRDYVVYDRDGNITDFYANSSYREDLEPGSRIVISIAGADDFLKLFYPAEWKDTVISVNEINTPSVLYFITLTGTESVSITNISGERAAMPKADGYERRNYKIYNADREETDSWDNTSSHGFGLDAGSTITISLADSSETLRLYFPLEMLNVVFTVQGD
ncbi:MAG: toll/interleukin-1 receptor domain-containing protein [Oscillospiraceae bacterium]|nr:toll/interleukin-1 receptor domain-containing protein [Oscillospiraceae bacterium]